MYRTFFVWLTLVALICTLSVTIAGLPQMAYSTSLGDSIREEVKDRVESNGNDEDRDESNESNDEEAREEGDESTDRNDDEAKEENDDSIRDNLRDTLDSLGDWDPFDWCCVNEDRDESNSGNDDEDPPSHGTLPSSPEFEGQDILSTIDYITKGDRSTDRDLEEFLEPIRNSGDTNTGDLPESPGNGRSNESPGTPPSENPWWLDGDDGTPRGTVPNFVIPPCSGVQFCDPSDTITIGERGSAGDGLQGISNTFRIIDITPTILEGIVEPDDCCGPGGADGSTGDEGILGALPGLVSPDNGGSVGGGIEFDVIQVSEDFAYHPFIAD